jgi:Na+-transporting methylmalonyl-CoA/oxaloacetate decarboxylase gamma subunit
MNDGFVLLFVCFLVLFTSLFSASLSSSLFLSGHTRRSKKVKNVFMAAVKMQKAKFLNALCWVHTPKKSAFFFTSTFLLPLNFARLPEK